MSANLFPGVMVVGRRLQALRKRLLLERGHHPRPHIELAERQSPRGSSRSQSYLKQRDASVHIACHGTDVFLGLVAMRVALVPFPSSLPGDP